MRVPNLPLQLTSFIGRELELGQVRQLLAGNRLVTLTGPGGVGKTRLALEVATWAQSDFSGGAWLVELASLIDPRVLAATVASSLGLRDDGARPIVDVLIEHLEHRQLLIVVDNCEHLLQVCASLVEQLLRSCPELRILATSREALKVPGEAAWLVPSLLPETDGQRLFLERAATAVSNAQSKDWSAEVVTTICRQLDGIPLAIELAASRLTALTPEQLCARLNDRFRLLSSGPRTALPRHQTLRALVDWSHDLLSEDERRLFRRLSVFAGGWTLEAAEAVCGDHGLPEGEVTTLLTQLVDKSLVSAHEEMGAYRYGLLEILRQYAAEQLDLAGETDAMRGRHLDHMVERAEPGYGDSSRDDLLRLLGPELDNVRSALSWSLDSGNILGGLRLAAALGTYWNVGGHPKEGHRWLVTLLERSPSSPPDELWKATRARALGALGYLATGIGDLAAAAEPMHEALALWRELGNGRQASFCVRWLGRIAILRQQPELARTYLEEALAIARAAGHERAIYEAQHALGIAVHEAGDADGAATLFQDALALAKEHGDLVWMHLCALNLGAVALERGDFGASRHWLAESVAAAPPNEGWMARTLEVFAALAAAEGQPERALRLAGAVAALEQAPGVTVPPRFLATIARQLQAVRRSVTSKRGEAVWAEGEAMDLASAIAFALEDESPLAKRPDTASELTVRERQVAALLAEGLTNPQIAERLVVSRGTVKRHIENILMKLGLESRSQVAAWAARQGLTAEAAATF